MSKETITHQEHLQLQGLALLAEKSVRRVDELQRAIAELLDVDTNSDAFLDTIGDVIWGHVPDADQEILRKLGISVEPKGGTK